MFAHFQSKDRKIELVPTQNKKDFIIIVRCNENTKIFVFAEDPVDNIDAIMVT